MRSSRSGRRTFGALDVLRGLAADARTELSRDPVGGLLVALGRADESAAPAQVVCAGAVTDLDGVHAQAAERGEPAVRNHLLVLWRLEPAQRDDRPVEERQRAIGKVDDLLDRHVRQIRKRRLLPVEASADGVGALRVLLLRQPLLAAGPACGEQEGGRHQGRVPHGDTVPAWSTAYASGSTP